VHTRPVVDAFDQAILDRVRRGIDDLVDDRGTVEEACNARFLGGPKVLPSTTQCVLATREQLVKMFDELRASPVAIEDDCMVMVRFGDRDEHGDIEARCGDTETIEERVVRGLIRPEQKLALRTSTRQEIELTWNDLPRARHGAGHSKPRAESHGPNFNRLGGGLSDVRTLSPKPVGPRTKKIDATFCDKLTSVASLPVLGLVVTKHRGDEPMKHRAHTITK